MHLINAGYIAIIQLEVMDKESKKLPTDGTSQQLTKRRLSLAEMERPVTP
jgi:hypothetical protein